MNKINYKFNKSKFIELKNNTKLIRIISFLLISFLFIIIFMISIFSNGLTFVSINEIVEQNLLRTLVGLSIGFGLAISGSSMQAVTRNDLSGPTTLGFLPAATLGILVYQILDFSSVPLMIFFSFLFSFIILFINFLSIKLSSNDIKGYKVVLIGIILGSLVSSISIILNNTIPRLNENIIPWVGQVGLNYDWERANYTLPIILISSITIILMSNKLNIIEKDPYLAKSLGININLMYWISGICSLLITVSSVILAGSLTMIGIVIPHLVRMLFKTKDYKIISPMSGMLCSTLIIFSLLINSRWNIGITFFTSIISAPLFIYLILRKKGV